MFVYGDFNVHHKARLTDSGGTYRPSEFCYNFSFSSDLIQMVNLPTRIPNPHYHNPAVLDLLILSDASFCSSVTFPPLGNLDQVVVSVSSEFPSK